MTRKDATLKGVDPAMVQELLHVLFMYGYVNDADVRAIAIGAMREGRKINETFGARKGK